MDRLLTEEQAADVLGVSPLTLSNWRNRREGPAWIAVGTDPAPDTAGKKGIRYRLSDLEAFMERRRTVPDLLAPPPTRRRKPLRTLTDEEWNLILNAVRPRGEDGYRSGYWIKEAYHRRLFDAMLAACDTGAWPKGIPGVEDGKSSPRHMLRRGVCPDGWVLKAFDALAERDDFPYVLAVQYVVVRRGRRRDLPSSSLRLRTDAHGPRHGRKVNALEETAAIARPIRRNRREVLLAAATKTGTCDVCGGSYPVFTKSQRFCSVKCRRMWHMNQDREKRRQR